MKFVFLSARSRALVGFLAVLLVASLAPVATAASRPDLVVASIKAPAGVTKGGTLSVTEITKNTGSGSAGASTTAYYLSKDAKKNSGDKKLGSRRVKTLGAGKSSKNVSSLNVPTSAPAAFYVVACADDARKIRESNERNNCRASRKVQVMDQPGEIDLTPFGPAEAVDVTPTRDNASAVTETITTDGGTMTASGPAGTSYTLTFPADALLSDAEITMTPITNVTGDPLGGTFVAAVDVEPEGLRFFKPVTLRIETPTSVPVAERAPFSYRRDGEDFHLYPSDPGAPAYTFGLTHANTYGLFRANAEARAAQVARNAEDPEDAFEQQLAAAYDAAVSRVARQTPENFVAEARAKATDYYKFVVRPMLSAAQTNSTLFREATQKWLSWLRQVQLLAIDNAFTQAQYDELEQMFLNGFKNYVDKTFERCLDHELAAIQELLSLERQAQLLGLDLGNSIMDKLEKCATFELEFSSRMDDTFNNFFGATGSTVTRVESLVAIPMFSAGENQAPSVMAEASGSITQDAGFGDPCTYSLSPGESGTFKVFSVGLELNVKDPDEDGRGEADPILNFIHADTGEPQETQSGCDNNGPSFQWLASWSDHHNDHNNNPVPCEAASEDNSTFYLTNCMFTGWEPSTTVGEIARLNIDNTIDSLGWHGVETTRLIFRHKPQQ